MDKQAIVQTSHPLTQQFIQQACETFRERCSSQGLTLQDLYNRVACDIAKEISKTISPKQALLLLQEHPKWIEATGNMPGGTIATIISDNLAYLLRHTLDERWADILLKPQYLPSSPGSPPRETSNRS